ncbi:MAG: hypothetical protein IK024_06415 [Treponema sp.]|nr:hypothetical protein [Treponema sp.]
MAKITSEEGFVLEFELLPRSKEDIFEKYFPVRCSLMYQNKPILNEDILRRDSDYSRSGFPGGFVGEEIDSFSLIEDLEYVRDNRKSRIWTSFPHEDLEVAIYPGLFPYIGEHDSEYFTFMFYPCGCRFKDVNVCSRSPVCFVMSPDLNEYNKFIEDLKKEYEQLKSLNV